MGKKSERKNIFITGAASGVGRATALLYAKKGWFVGLYDVNEKGLQWVASEIGKENCCYSNIDIRDLESWDRAIAHYAKHTNGTMNILFNNAGIVEVGAFCEVPIEQSMRVIDVNLKGMMYGCHAALDILKKTNKSRIINMSSVGAVVAIPDFAAYAATKSAVSSITETLNIEYREFGIHVIDLRVIFIKTPMVDLYSAPSSMDRIPIKLPVNYVAKLAWKARHKRKMHIDGLGNELFLLMRIFPQFLRRACLKALLMPSKKRRLQRRRRLDFWEDLKALESKPKPTLKKKKNVFITGASSYFGLKLVEHFNQQDDVARIIGIDTIEPGQSYTKFEFIQHDIRQDMTDIIAENDIDWAINAANCLPTIHTTKLMEDVNLNGTINFLKTCLRCNVEQMMEVSSLTAYGFNKDNPPLLDENSKFRGNENLTYAKNKKEIETICADLLEAFPDTPLTIVRPCFVVGPGFTNPMVDHLKKKMGIQPTDAYKLQFVHEDDLVECMYQLFDKKKYGAYNIAPDGTITFEEMVKMLGGSSLKLPPFLLYPLNSLAWKLRLSFLTGLPTPALGLMRHPILGNNEKIKNTLGYKFKYTTKEAFQNFTNYTNASKIAN